MIYTEYRHGGDVFGAARKFNRQPREIYDFSANINPLGPSHQALKAIKDNLDLISHYPDPRCAELRMALSRYLDIPPANMLLGNGASELIYLLARVLAFRRAVVCSPTFVEYGAAVVAAGGTVVEVPMEERDNFTLPVSKIKKSLREADSVFICNPNNPTGRAEKKPIIQTVIKEAQDRNAVVVVDEAFIDFVERREQYSVMSLLPKYSKLVVLYSMTKFFGIPGLRLGVLLGTDSLVKRLEPAKDPWNVNMLAQIAGTAALADTKYMEETRQLVWQEREFLFRAITRIPGLQAFPGDANYLLIKIEDDRISSSVLAERTAQRGVLVRDCANFAGLGHNYIRVAVKTRRENVALLNALAKAVKGE
ncbi:threonine-phosphate decarboxylase CobD [Desulfoscipio geothermicus]|uniref:threonine-phosphate decarboxylase n=1 Tax=Desulfoscipio geothermicus DSM 3669 TaxID=1121426 RepID=A0A1I6D924_9FIRM|nr:threonine-phosphate decarboxylase CobD [Desulfoscipio geothermicus]SFR01970.1 L-threonine O-3-phosphate decarboxylase [Desulfoscipio geothermicus DSM 3669]